MAALSGSVAIVTGASRGIGAAAAEALAAAGAAVMLTARDGKLAAKVADKITAAGGKAAAHACDVADYAAMEALVAATTQRFGRPGILVNNAGVIEPIATIAQSDPAAWAKNVQINLVGAYNAAAGRSSTSPPAPHCARWKAGAPIVPARPAWRC
jgi:NAD(P)-dependent dehydrogenase (short-subunit alcohol dehydrogenase family)